MLVRLVGFVSGLSVASVAGVVTVVIVVIVVIVLGAASGVGVNAHAAPRLTETRLDEGDRAAFRRWFTLLADAQFERRTDDVIDCASLVRHAYREALRPHSAEWLRRARLPRVVSYPDVRHRPPIRDGAWLLFKVAARPPVFAEFADAATIVRLNARAVGRDAGRAQPGDLLYFHHAGADSPDHLMVVIGPSVFDPDRRDWLVYHTGPQDGGPGEVRKVSLADLQRHPASRWRPLPANAAFVGVFRLNILDVEGRSR